MCSFKIISFPGLRAKKSSITINIFIYDENFALGNISFTVLLLSLEFHNSDKIDNNSSIFENAYPQKNVMTTDLWSKLFQILNYK